MVGDVLIPKTPDEIAMDIANLKGNSRYEIIKGMNAILEGWRDELLLNASHPCAELGGRRFHITMDVISYWPQQKR